MNKLCRVRDYVTLDCLLKYNTFVGKSIAKRFSYTKFGVLESSTIELASYRSLKIQDTVMEKSILHSGKRQHSYTCVIVMLH